MVLCAACLLMALGKGTALAGSLDVWGPLVTRLEADGMDRSALTAYFSSPGVAFDPAIMARKVDAMVRNRFEPVTVTRRTLEKSGYRRFLDPWTISKAGRYMAEKREVFAAAEKTYGVPAEVLAAILLVETKLGDYLGDREAFGVLASMALCRDFELIRSRLKSLKSSPERTAFAEQAAREKGDWAYEELKALLAYAQAKKMSPLAIPGSIYGAIGICQFMPTNALKFGWTPTATARWTCSRTRTPSTAWPTTCAVMAGARTRARRNAGRPSTATTTATSTLWPSWPWLKDSNPSVPPPDFRHGVVSSKFVYTHLIRGLHPLFFRFVSARPAWQHCVRVHRSRTLDAWPQ